ncbi:MAG TPA: FAD-dependent oxidoreductase [Usitatibacter sp.]|nr:FAD-dependent oxidoreductase [Usitatibacter sp.]
MSKGKLAVVALIVAAIAAFFAFDLKQYLSLEVIKSQSESLKALVAANPVKTAATFFAIYVAVTGLSLPGAGILTLVAGAVFGFLWGVVLVSFASSIGATIAFLASRYLLRDWVQSKFARFLKPINEGIEKDGAFYLLSMRLIPQIPFFVINLVMGLTPIRTTTFYWVSQVGMFAGTLAYVYAGTQLAQVTSVKDVLSPGLITAFLILAVFPLAAKKIVDGIRARKVYAKWPKPAKFDRNMVVIGAGSAGLVSAYIAAAVKAKVTLVERHKMGGDCLNTGCVPSKALIKTAKLLHQIRHASDYGVKSASAELDFARAMERVKKVVATVEPHDSVERYTGLGVECVKGSARITSPWSVEVELAEGGKRTFTTKNIVIATGARPFIPPIPGLGEANPLHSDNVWDLRVQPKRLVVLGGGPIGSELAQAFARLGSKVTQIEMLPRIMAKEDPEFSEMVARRFREDGIEVLVGHKAKEVRVEGGEKIVVVEHEGAEKRIACDEILCAVGRAANTQGFGLEELGIGLTKQRTVEVNEYLQATYPNIYACGDAIGPYQFTHTASHTAWYCAVNGLFGRFKRFKVDYSVIPWATFTDPEVARVGLNETEAKEKGIACDVFTYGIDDLDRAIAESENRGLVKVLTAKGTDKIIGCTIAGANAGETIVEFVAAMRHGFGLNKILGTIHIYPTWAESNKYAAGVWKRSTVTRGQMEVATTFNDWTRGDAGVGAVIAKLFSLGDKRPYYQVAESHGDD